MVHCKVFTLSFFVAGGVSPIPGSERAHRSLPGSRAGRYWVQSSGISGPQLEVSKRPGPAGGAHHPGDGEEIWQIRSPDPSQVRTLEIVRPHTAQLAGPLAQPRPGVHHGSCSMGA